MKIAVVGSNGFVGSHICRAQITDGNEVYAICNKNTESVPNECIISSVEQLKDIYLDQLFVAIGSYASSHREFTDQYQLLVEIIDKLKFGRIIFISSTAVYGNHTDIITEGSCYNKPSVYGLAKLSQEFLISGCDDFVIIRPSYIYGTGMSKNSLLPVWVQQALSKRKIAVFGDGKRKQDYLHIDDLVLLCALAGKSGGKHTIIAASGSTCTNIELAEIIAGNVTDTSIDFIGTDASASYEFDISRTNILYHWYPKMTLHEGVLNYLEVARTHLQ